MGLQAISSQGGTLLPGKELRRYADKTYLTPSGTPENSSCHEWRFVKRYHVVTIRISGSGFIGDSQCATKAWRTSG